MTAKITISITYGLKELIAKYNDRHPFEPLIISHLAQKAIFEKIKAEDPELLTITTTQLPQITPNIKELPAVQTKETLLEKELAQPSQEKPKTLEIHKPQKTTKNQQTVICAECGETFLAERKTRRFCSGKCKTAYGRKFKKDHPNKKRI